MIKQLFKDGLVWGIGLWLVGYLIGILLFAFVPSAIIGWIILPLGTLITLWVLWKKIKTTSIEYYFKLGVIWMVMAVTADYFLLVKLFNPPDGYYKIDIYLYYALTLLLPIIIGWQKSNKRAT